MSAAELAKKITKLLASSHSNVPQVFELCNDAVAKEKIDAQTSDLYEIIPRVREIAEAASCMACQLDSFHEGYPTCRDEPLLDEITDKVSAESQGVDEAATNLERIADDYEDKVNARLSVLDPENYDENYTYPEEEA
jgi:hypothetical protein